MRIENFQFLLTNTTARIQASVIWEDCDRPTCELFIETESRFAEYLCRHPYPFLVAAVPPALHFGERRIRVDGEICPVLRDGLLESMGWLKHWFLPGAQSVTLEAGTAKHGSVPSIPRRSGSFLSGGVDSLATLRYNRLHVPLEHPASIQVCLFVHGFDILWKSETESNSAFFRQSLASLSHVADDAGVTLVPVVTNLRLLNEDTSFWMGEFFGAALSAIGHACDGGLNTIRIASGADITSMEPWGSHPVLDPCYSSHNLQIIHDGILLTRLDKIRLISDWPIGLLHLRVCTSKPEQGLNCDVCEKCVRTKLELLVVGALDRVEAFPTQTVTKDALDGITIDNVSQEHFYRELVPYLESLGRKDLTSILNNKFRGFAKNQAWLKERDWKGLVKRMDRGLLRGRIMRFWRTRSPLDS